MLQSIYFCFAIIAVSIFGPSVWTTFHVGKHECHVEVCLAGLFPPWETVKVALNMRIDLRKYQQLLTKLVRRMENHAINAILHQLFQTIMFSKSEKIPRVANGTNRKSTSKHVHDLHWQVQTR